MPASEPLPETLSPRSEAPQPIDAVTAVAVTLALSVTGTMLFKVLPLVVGAAAETFGWSPDQLGMLASADLAGIAVASVLAPLWVRRFNWRTAAVIALLLVIGGNLLSVLTDQLSALLAVRFVTGLGEGTATGLGLVILGETRNPDRSFGLAMAAPILVGLVGFQVLPVIRGEWGFDGVVLSFAVVATGILLCMKWLPRAGRPRPPVAATGQADLVTVFVALFGTAFYHMALGAVWAFIERMGVAAGLEAAFISNTLGTAVLCGLFGALAATAVGIRFGRGAPLSVAVILQAGSLLLLGNEMSGSAYFAAACLFQFFWLFAGPYQLGVIAAADRSGRFFVLTIAFQAGGITLGPVVAGMLLTQWDFTAVRLFGGIGMLLGAALLVAVSGRRRAL